MLEHFIANRAAVQRLRSGVIGSHLDGFIEHLASLGYAPTTVRSQVGILGRVDRWMARRRPSRCLGSGSQVALDQQQPGRRTHRPVAVLQDDAVPLVVPVVDHMLEQVGVSAARTDSKKLPPTTSQRSATPASSSSGFALSTTCGRSNSTARIPG